MGTQGENVLNCPSCGTAIPEAALFCPWCGKQARCKSCREPLLSGARACMMCGLLVGAGDGNGPPNDQQKRDPGMLNSVALVETGKRRSLTAHLSDAAVGVLGETLQRFIEGRAAGHGLLSQPSWHNPQVATDQRQLPLPILAGELRDFTDTEIAKSVQVITEDYESGSSRALDPPPTGTEEQIQHLMSLLDRSAHPEIAPAGRVLDKAVNLLRIVRDDFGIDGLTAPQIARILSEKFRLPTSPQSVRTAFDRAHGIVDRVPGPDGAFRHRVTAHGEAYLADSDTGTTKPSARTRPRGGHRRKVKVQTDSEIGSSPSKRAGSPPKRTESRPGPKGMIEKLISDGFFEEGKTIGQVKDHLKKQYGYQYSPNQLSPSLVRLLRDGVLQRSTREDDGQYEYTKA